MGNKKQTALDWLIEKLKTQNGTYKGFKNIAITHSELIKQAKEMEKQQIIDAVDGFPIENRNMLGEEYYQETYGE